MHRTICRSFIFINKNGSNPNVYQQMNEQINKHFIYLCRILLYSGKDWSICIHNNVDGYHNFMVCKRNHIKETHTESSHFYTYRKGKLISRERKQIMNCSLPGSSVHGILQAKIFEWLAISFSRGSPQLMDGTWVSCVSCIVVGFFTHWGTWRVHKDCRDPTHCEVTKSQMQLRWLSMHN